MQVALISDIHSHLVALDAVLDELDRIGVDRVVCLGDIVDLGPYPTETIARLRERNVSCIQGNHDPLDDGPTIPFLADVEAWTRDALSAEDLAWLEGLPKELTLDLDGTKLHCVHGSPRSFTDDILATTPDDVLRSWTDAVDFDVLACGHTHVQLLRRLGSRWIVNVGSTGQPFEQPFAGQGEPTILPFYEFAIVKGGRTGPAVELRRLAADRAAVERATRASQMPHAEQWLGQWRW
ncbi:MAG: metallophosphoesterase family protein [Sandaracinaceae bacterium]|nr:metallophosphoesterase family protein [Sandaracinaceae bacterium]